VWERCRFCGSTDARRRLLVDGEHACPSCAGSPLCDRCGHPRRAHTGVFRRGGRSCARVRTDFQTGVRVSCGCEGFAPVDGPLRDAGFVDRDADDGLPPLRLARRADDADAA
jgi:hypothetical protein